MHVCIYEDRPSDHVAVRLLLATLRDQVGAVTLDVTLPAATPDECAAIARKFGATVGTHAGGSGTGYDTKPTLLRRALAAGAAEVMWIDSDILVTGDFRPLVAAAPPDALVVAEETFGVPHQGGTVRTRGLGLPIGRALHSTANTCVVRVTRAHLPLLAAWEHHLGTAAYRDAQALPLIQRPQHYKGDQDVLSALLGSAAFADVPIHWLRRGRDVAHCFQAGGVGYNVVERAGNLLRRTTPAFVHSCGDRPWRPPSGAATLHLETSPYTLVAARYAADIGTPLEWTAPHLRSARLLRRMFQDGVNATGFLPALAREVRDQRFLKTAFRTLLADRR